MRFKPFCRLGAGVVGVMTEKSLIHDLRRFFRVDAFARCSQRVAFTGGQESGNYGKPSKSVGFSR